VACLVEPYADLVSTAEGRAYVRVVAQLRGRFAAWRVESDAETTRHLAGILDELERRSAAAPAARRERVVGLIVLLTGTVAERARRIDDGIAEELDHGAFVENLAAMCAAVVAA
jgi:TetR/AcrR family transcriptional regulator, regulator of cefoperazone and chloramphenicol sensitivity